MALRWAAVQDLWPETHELPNWVHRIANVLDRLLAFFDLPAEDWKHLQTSNPIRPACATARHRRAPRRDQDQ